MSYDPYGERKNAGLQGNLRRAINAIKSDDLNSFINCTRSFNMKSTFDFVTTEDKLVLQTGAVVIQVMQGATLLHIAVWYSAHRIIEHILKEDAANLIDCKTIEGFTPLHVAAGVGDFIAVEMLCKAGANLEITDTHGRNALHHGIVSDPQTAALLCSYNKDLVIVSDSKYQTPVHYAMDPTRSACYEFLSLLYTKIMSTEEEQIGKAEETMDDNKKTCITWIPLNIKTPVCVNPSKNPVFPELCVCNTPMNQHDVISKNPQFIEALKRQNIQYYELPTDTYGDIEIFSGAYAHNFVRVSDETNTDQIINLFTKVWKLPRPQLILSFYGDYADAAHTRERIRRLIWKVSESTKTWVITDGMKSNLSVIASGAVRDYIQAYGEGQVECLGIVPWKFISDNKVFTTNSYSGCFPASFSSDATESKSHFILDPNPTHYIFVDTAKQATTHYEYNYRSKIELALKRWQVQSQDPEQILAEAPIQICAFLAGGDESTLKAVYGSMQNRIPIVLLRGTGKLADIITQCMEDTELGSKATYKKAISEGAKGIEGFQLSPANIRQTLEYYWDKVAHPELSVLMMQEILNKPFLFSVCETDHDDEAGELDYHLLSLLMNPAIMENYKADELNETLLSIAIAMNRGDIARDKVFIEGAKWDDAKLVKHMNALLLTNKVQLIRVFIEKGFSLSNYLNTDNLQLLYTKSVHSEHPGETLINVIRAFAKIPDKITLYLIGRALRELIGRQFSPTYMSPNFLLVTSAVPEAQLFENPATDLFIWSLLTERSELADYFWTLVQDPLPASLFAALILRRLAMNATSLVTREAMFQYSRSFETKAYSLLTECYNDNQSLSFKTIVLERKLFGHMSCLMLAAEGKSMSFISHQCSEQYLERVWNGAIDPRSGMFPFVVALIIGIILPPLVPLSLKFRHHDNPDDKFEYDRKPRKSQDRKSSLDSKRIQSDSSQRSKKSISTYFQKLKGFYVSPCVRFSYTTLSYVAFLCFFTYVLLFSTELILPIVSIEGTILYIWVISFVAEHIRQGMFGEIPFKIYLAKLWKCLEVMAIILFFLGGALQLLVLTEESERLSFTPVNPVSAIQEALTQLSRIFFGLSLCIFYHRILELFTVNIRLGPMVIMVQSMIVRDLIPFLAVFTVVITGFAILQWVTAFKSTASLNPIVNIYTIFKALQVAYFQVFGEYEMDTLTGETLLDSCKESKVNCPGGWSRWLPPILLGVYVILTQVLLLNLVIAMFASTYMRIESASTKYWALQRYQIIGEYVNRPPLPPPLNLIWYIYAIIRYLIGCCRKKPRKIRHPFSHNLSLLEKRPKKSFEPGSPQEIRLIHWERLRFWDYDRYVIQGKRRRHAAGSRSVSVRTTVMHAPSYGEPSSELSTAIQTYHQTTQEFLTRVEVRTERLKVIEEKVDRLLKLLKDFKGQPFVIGQPLKAAPIGMDQTYDSRIDRILAEVERQQTARMKSPDQIVPRVIQTAKGSQMLVFEKNMHRFAAFVPPTADRTPRLFPTPISWEKQIQTPLYLGWKPPVYSIEGWTEANDFNALPEERKRQLRTQLPHVPAPDPVTGLPRNPGGRTALIFLVTKVSYSNPSGSGETSGDPFKFIGFKNPLCSQLPWFLVQHPSECRQEQCTKEMIEIVITSRMRQLIRLHPENQSIIQETVNKLKKISATIIHSGYIDDSINTDHAWIEPVATHIHIPTIEADDYTLLQLFSVEGVHLTWLNPTETVGMRKSHKKILRRGEKSFRPSRKDGTRSRKEVKFDRRTE
uniref:ANK_REP_REGION domain-containing protein n=1 Tax=Trichobilharzia regenti TaxID=157069 RepID=A0AA85JXM1_TRIRE|nr:unnamed protein product [Trichobilharzia regenti]